MPNNPVPMLRPISFLSPVSSVEPLPPSKRQRLSTPSAPIPAQAPAADAIMATPPRQSHASTGSLGLSNHFESLAVSTPAQHASTPQQRWLSSPAPRVPPSMPDHGLDDFLQMRLTLNQARFYIEGTLQALPEGLREQLAAVKDFELSNCVCQGPAVGRLAEVLSYLDAPDTLRLPNIDLGDEGMAALPWHDLGTLKAIDLSFNDISATGLRVLHKAAGRRSDAPHISTRCLQSLTDLDLEGNPLGIKGARILGRLLQRLPRLEALRIHGTGLTAKGFSAIGWAQMAKLKEIWAGDNGLTDACVTKLVEGCGAKLQTLDLSENPKIGLRGARSLNFHACPALVTLDLTDTGIGDAWAQHAHPALSQNITSLSLSGTKLTDTGVIQLDLPAVQNLTELQLSRIGWSRRTAVWGALAMVEGLEELTLLQSNLQSEEGALRLDIERMTKLQELNITDSAINEVNVLQLIDDACDEMSFLTASGCVSDSLARARLERHANGHVKLFM